MATATVGERVRRSMRFEEGKRASGAAYCGAKNSASILVACMKQKCWEFRIIYNAIRLIFNFSKVQLQRF